MNYTQDAYMKNIASSLDKIAKELRCLNEQLNRESRSSQHISGNCPNCMTRIDTIRKEDEFEVCPFCGEVIRVSNLV